jgi:nucleolar protein 4
MGLRWLNCHPVEIPANPDNEERDTKKRLIVEFAIENAQVIKRRQELQEKEKEKAKAKEEQKAKEEAEAAEEAKQKGTKRKHSQTRDGKGKGKGKEAEEDEEDEEENKIAKRNRIIAKKRAQRKGRKGR